MSRSPLEWEVIGTYRGSKLSLSYSVYCRANPDDCFCFPLSSLFRSSSVLDGLPAEISILILIVFRWHIYGRGRGLSSGRFIQPGYREIDRGASERGVGQGAEGAHLRMGWPRIQFASRVEVSELARQFVFS